MLVTAQRVSSATLFANKKKQAVIAEGMLLYLSIGKEDTVCLSAEAGAMQNQYLKRLLAFQERIVSLEMFDARKKHEGELKPISKQPRKESLLGLDKDREPAGKLGGAREILIVSQFTLHARFKKGRPSFDRSAPFEAAKEIYDRFVEAMKQRLGEATVKTGVFGASMKIHAELDGPVTFLLRLE